MNRRRISFTNALLAVLLITAGQVFAVTDAKVEEPTTGALANTVSLPSTANSAATSVPVFDFQIVNPTSSGSLPLMIDRIKIAFSTAASSADLGGMKVKVSGTSNPTFTNTDSILVSGVDPTTAIIFSAASTGNLTIGPAANDNGGDADLLSVANGDTVKVTVYAWLTATAKDTKSLTVNLANIVGNISVDGTNSDAITSSSPSATTIYEETAFTITSTAGTPGGLDTTVTVPSTATSKAVAVSVFQFRLTDSDDSYATRVSRLDGLTIPITLGGGMDAADIAGASLLINSSTPDDDTQFSATVGGDREINTANDPNYLKLVTVGSNLELRAGLNAGVVGTANNGTADLLQIPDPGLIAAAPHETVTITVKIWLANSGITGNSTATFDLKAANVAIDNNGVVGTPTSDVLNLNTDVPNGVATIIVAGSQNTTLSDRSVVPSAVTLPSSAVSLATSYKVFDFFVTDGIGGTSTKIDSLTIPVTLSGGAKFADLEGAKLYVGGGAVAAVFSPAYSISTSGNPTLAKIDSVSATQARLTFKGRATINTADAVADLAELPDGGSSGEFTVAVWVDTASIAYGATLTFDLQNSGMTLTGQSSDGLAASQNVTDGVATIAVARISDVSAGAIPNPDTLSSAAIANGTGANAADNAVAVFDFQIIDPLDGAPLRIDGLRIPLTFSGGADIADVVGAKLVVSGLSSNIWKNSVAGSSLSAIFSSASTATGRVEIDATAQAVDVGSLTAQAQSSTAGLVDALNIPDGETATITVSLWLSAASLVDSSKVNLALSRTGIIKDNAAGATTVVAANQSASGAGIIRAATLADNSAVPASTYLSSVHTGASTVNVYGFKVVDPPDGEPTKVEKLVLTVTGTGVSGDIGDVSIAVSGAVFSGAGSAVAADGILSTTNGKIKRSATFPATGQTLTMGRSAGGNADGTADLVLVPDGTTLTFLVSVESDGAVSAGTAVTFDLTTAAVTVDGGLTAANNAGAIATSQDLTDKVVTMSAATTLVADLATVGNSVSLSSLANTAGGAVAVFDFTITDAAAGVATNLDELTIPVTFSGVDFADVAGVKVTTSGTFDASSETNGGDNTLTSGADAGIELQSTTGGMNILLGGATAAVVTASDGGPELLPVSAASANLTIAVYLSNTSGALTDGGTLTFNLGSANLVVDGTTSDAVIPSQSVTAGVATIAVVATKLAFTGPASTTLATNGVSDTVRVVAADANNNVDVNYSTSTTVSTSTATGQFSANGSTFLAVSTPYTQTPTSGVLKLFYKDSATGTATLTAASAGLTSGTLALTLQAFSVTVNWTSPAIGSTTVTDSSGTSHRLQYAITSNDPKLLVEFWAAQSPTLPSINSQNAVPLTVFNPDTTKVLGKLRNPTGTAFGPGTNKAPATDIAVGVNSQYVYTSGLSASTWYIYMVRGDGNGQSAGGDTLARSGALRVLHYPNIVAFGLTEAADGTVDNGTTFSRDSGGNTPNTQIRLLLYTEDHNSNDTVQVYISTNASLTASTVTSDTTTTFRVKGTTTWRTNDVGDTLRYATVNISDTLGSATFHTKGTYYFYARVMDADSTSVGDFAKAGNLSGQQQSLGVNHGPTLAFSQPSAPVLNLSLTSTPQLMIAWNGTSPAGDRDIDDNAAISLYFAPKDSIPDAFADTSQAWLKKIVTGLTEDPDGGANDQYSWNLNSFDGLLPAAGDSIRVWALLNDGGGSPVFVATPKITFAAYTPVLKLLNPPPGPAVDLRENETYRFFFDANYVSNTATNATVRYLISSLNSATASQLTFDTGASASFPGNYNSFWISGSSQLSEGVNRYLDWTPKDDGNNYTTEINPLTTSNSTVYVYAVIKAAGGSITSPVGTGQVLAQAPGRIEIGSIGAQVTSPAVGASPNQSEVTVGDTVRVLLKANTNSTSVQGMRLYVNLDSTKFAIVDQDASTAGVQPFGFGAGYFFSSVSAQINRVTTSSGVYKLDLDKRNLSAPEDPTGKTVAHVDLVARVFVGTAVLNWNLDSVNDPNRIPTFFNSGGVVGVPFNNPLATFTSVGRGTVSGFVPLEGPQRTSDSKVTTFWLRKPGSWVSIVDTVFTKANDDSSTVEGVQRTTGTDGSFTLTQVPSGVYELVAKSESYLAAYASVDVVNGQTVTGVRPTLISSTNDPGQLIAGDITGDNKIDASDESALNLAYESMPGSSNFNSAADIDDDNFVFLSDLLLMASNLRVPLLTGVAPVYKLVDAQTGGELTLSGLPLEVQAGEEFALDLKLEDAVAMVGYSLDLVFDPALLEVVGVETSTASPTVQVQRLQGPGQYVLAEVFRGGQAEEVGQEPLARVQFRALQAANAPGLSVERAYLAGAGGQLTSLTSRVARVVPKHFALWPNSPNPFNPSTQITFDVPEGGVGVTLAIYNMLGQPIYRFLDSESIQPGRYILSWNGRDQEGRYVGSGVYYYTLRAGAFSQTRRMTLMK